MPKMFFLNLPVSSVGRATAFYESIGATKNPMFSDESGSCMVFSDTIFVMLLNHDKFMHFSPRKIADAKTSTQALFCLSADSRAEVDAIVEKAGKSGGQMDPSPKDEYPFMYGRSFEDLDGHLWGIDWMDLEAFKKATGKG